jgi:hypothetical protein
MSNLPSLKILYDFPFRSYKPSNKKGFFEKAKHIWKYNISKTSKQKRGGCYYKKWRTEKKCLKLDSNAVQCAICIQYRKKENWRDVSTVFWGWMGPTQFTSSFMSYQKVFDAVG